jgi:hypothetical protein
VADLENGSKVKYMPCLDCADYEDFYVVLASCMLMVLSIITAGFIYLGQRQSERQTILENIINGLTDLIYRFCDIVDKAGTLDLDRTVSSSKNEVEKTYREAKEKSEDYAKFLKYYNTLQFQISENFADHSRKYQESNELSGSSDIRRYKIDMQNFEDWIGDILSDLNEAKETHEYLHKIIIDVKKNWRYHYLSVVQRDVKYFENFYEQYWDILMDIRRIAIKIDAEMKNNNKKWHVWDSGMSLSNICLLLSLLSMFFFGFIIPIYMLQPNKLRIFYCSDVFYIIILFLVISVMLIYIAYRKRHIYGRTEK